MIAGFLCALGFGGVPLVERKINQFATMRGNKMAV